LSEVFAQAVIASLGIIYPMTGIWSENVTLNQDDNVSLTRMLNMLSMDANRALRPDNNPAVFLEICTVK
jgi:hypothetical protein